MREVHKPLTNAVHAPHKFRMDKIQALFLLVETYCRHAGIAEATLSSQLFSDGKRLKSLRAGADIGVRRMEKAIRWLDEHWPDGCDWPCDVPRVEKVTA